MSWLDYIEMFLEKYKMTVGIVIFVLGFVVIKEEPKKK